jgi:hypothetical protein
MTDRNRMIGRGDMTDRNRMTGRNVFSTHRAYKTLRHGLV